MNQRIKELAEQAGFSLWTNEAWKPNGAIVDWSCNYDRELEKFAELIVRECAEACMKEIDTGWVMAPKSPWMAKQILEHFGVEE